jgi:hypothetical protein
LAGRLGAGAGGIRSDSGLSSRSVSHADTSNRRCRQDIINGSSISPGSRWPSDSSRSPSRQRPCEGAPTISEERFRVARKEALSLVSTRRVACLEASCPRIRFARSIALLKVWWWSPVSGGPSSAAHRPGGSEAFDAGSRGFGDDSRGRPGPVLRRTGFVCRDPRIRHKSFQGRKVIARCNTTVPESDPINPTEFAHGRLSGSYRSREINGPLRRRVLPPSTFQFMFRSISTTSLCMRIEQLVRAV